MYARWLLHILYSLPALIVSVSWSVLERLKVIATDFCLFNIPISSLATAHQSGMFSLPKGSFTDFFKAAAEWSKARASGAKSSFSCCGFFFSLSLSRCLKVIIAGGAFWRWVSGSCGVDDGERPRLLNSLSSTPLQSAINSSETRTPLQVPARNFPGTLGQPSCHHIFQN